ncbi:Protein air1 [Colletotrichum trifolii]|uniref:Protein air1 n=1 Tax=Colletotrichum trifolii TaxID=5466 RepID=A0A4R8RKT0_COLTR|nr:Protein air1 [Colletotrichum trifolii]
METAQESTSVQAEVAETQQPSKKRSLEDVSEAGPNASEHRQAPSEPEAKRARTQPAEMEGDDSIEEGELEEDGEASSAPASEPAAVGGDAAKVAMAPALKEENRRVTRSASKGPAAHAGWNQGITSRIRTSLGGSTTLSKAPVAEPKEATLEPEKAPSSAPASPIPAPDSLAPASQAPAPPAPVQAVATDAHLPPPPAEPAKPPKTRQERRQEKQKEQVLERQKASEERRKPWEYAPGLTFSLPIKKNILQPKGNNLGAGVWKAKFKSWCQSFVSRNIAQKDSLNAEIVHAALHEYIANRAHWTKKKHQGVAAAEARKPQAKNDIAVNLATILKDDAFLMTSGEGTQESPMVIDDDDGEQVAPHSADTTLDTPAATHTSPHSIIEVHDSDDDQKSPVKEAAQSVDQPDDEMEVDGARPGPRLMSEEEDLAQQRKYFPGLAATEKVCVFCAAPGHTSSSCPKTACTFCQVPGHFYWNCPTRERCTKCRQLGHSQGQCKEKLVHLDEEGMECAACGSTKHLENECEALWRSYKPRKSLIKKVNALPAFCASCGRDSHYSSDCALRGELPRSATWSLGNRSLYLDKNAPDGPISNFASMPALPQLNIKGSAAKRNHIFYPDSDGSEDGEFIGKKVQPRAPIGNIQMSSNIQFGNVGHAPTSVKRTPGQPGWQPPLPPGPPPPAPGPPTQGSYSRMSKSHNNQSRPPPPNNVPGRGGLPPKPPAPQHGFHNGPPPNGPASARKPRTRNGHGGQQQNQNQQNQNSGGPATRRSRHKKRGGQQG